MCGIAGWNLTKKPDVSFYAILAHAMLDRGRDSFGYYNGAKITRGTGPIIRGIPARELSSLVGFLHTRHATTGDITKQNSHPFEIGGLIGAHNGIVYNHETLNKTYGRKCAVDSMHIFEHISQGLALADVEGYGAIEFVRDGELFIGYCNGGQLHAARTDAGIVYASTDDAIEDACAAAGITLETFYKLDTGRLYRVASDNLYETQETFQMDAKKPAKNADWRDFKRGFASTNNALGALDKQEAEFRHAWHMDTDTVSGVLDSGESKQDWCEICSTYDYLFEYEDMYLCEDCLDRFGYGDELDKLLDEHTGPVSERTTWTHVPDSE